ncbi:MULTISPECIES: hypothetical protein [Microbacterium]|uniref:hypothetical protein n=1 Tax=Microbacterium TaxID=33882 RepID=UPI0013A58E94|nr:MULTISPECIES: hypothetical protein [Microbacterium]
MRYRILAILACFSIPLLATGCVAVDEPKATPLNDYFSSDEDSLAIVRCLSADGWDATFIEEDGSVEMRASPGQEAKLDAAFATCMEDLKISKPTDVSSADIDVAYAWYEEISECLDSYEWPTPPIPSRQSFHDSYDDSAWLPWSEIPAQDLPRAVEQCPVMQRPR